MQNVLIKKISISFVSSTYELNTFSSYFFTGLCFWLLMNSFNLADGLNGVAISYALVIFISIFLIIDTKDCNAIFIEIFHHRNTSNKFTLVY